MINTIDFYNVQQIGFSLAKKLNSNIKIDDYISSDHLKISWTVNLKKDVEKSIIHKFNIEEIITSTYRPFFKQFLYFDKPFIERPGLWSKLFPKNNSTNLIISITGIGGSKDFAPLITNTIPNLHLVENGQYFPLYYYEERKIEQKSLFDTEEDCDSQYLRRDAISNFIFERAQKQYGKNVTKEDIFYYVYGFLHSPEYREKFANDLKKMLPRLPLLEDVREFWAFSKAGRKLADLHINYEKVPAYDEVRVKGAEKLNFMCPEPPDTKFFKVEKMRFPKKDQKDKIIYNSHITIENIPTQAYEYLVNGKSAIEWIMERYQVSIDKASKIKNDPIDWAKEVGNPRYILDLLLSIINVSIQTIDIVENLPKLKFDTE